MNFLQRFTSLDRAIDLRYASNWYALLITIAAGALMGFLGSSVGLIGSSAGWVFLTWALGRELDPDKPITAAIASAGVLLLLGIYPEARAWAFAALCATGTLMVLARAGSGCTGRDLKIGDVLLVALAPTLAAFLTGQELGFLSISSLLVLLLHRAPFWSFILPVLSLVWFSFTVSIFFPTLSIFMALLLLALAIIGYWKPLPNSSSDTGTPLETKFWRWLQLVIFASASLTALFTPFILWLALALVGIVSGLLELRPKGKA